MDGCLYHEDWKADIVISQNRNQKNRFGGKDNEFRFVCTELEVPAVHYNISLYINNKSTYKTDDQEKSEV